MRLIGQVEELDKDNRVINSLSRMEKERKDGRKQEWQVRWMRKMKSRG